jgi:glycosyltransferase Alg8
MRASCPGYRNHSRKTLFLSQHVAGGQAELFFVRPVSKNLPCQWSGRPLGNNRKEILQSSLLNIVTKRTGRTDRFIPTKAGWQASLVTAIAFSGLACLLIVYLPTDAFDPASHIFILSIGLVAFWRYGWWFTHYVRALVYRCHVFPKARRIADTVTAQGYRPRHIYVLCTSYRIDPAVSYAVYEGIIRNAMDYGVPTTVFASISDRTDVDVLGQLLTDYGDPANVHIRYMFQRGDGKRSAMAEVLRAIQRCDPGPDDLVVFMDGDIRLPRTTFRRSMPFFLFEEDLGAVTTNNRAIVDGSDITKEWYDLRYAQRHMLMCSTSLSRRVLVLTGRYSVIRADLCTRRDFIELVEDDRLTHPRFGTFKLLSGDDKSTWYWLLKNNWAMRYVPDAHAYGFEKLPGSGSFLEGSISLMRRWFGNMFRTSARAISLGPRGMGLFTWWCLVDQRLSVWTTLIGPTVAVMVSVLVRPSFALAYLLWIMATRLIASMLLGAAWGRVSALWPMLLYYNQVGGAALKSFINFRYNQQSWTRQGIRSLEAADPRRAARLRHESAVMHIASLSALVAIVAFSTGALGFPDRHSWQTIWAGNAAGSDDFWLAASLKHTPQGMPVLLPPEPIEAHWRVFDTGKDVHVRGAGADRTELRLAGLSAAEMPAGDGAHVRCEEGEKACLINGHVRMSNLTLTFHFDRDTSTSRD